MVVDEDKTIDKVIVEIPDDKNITLDEFVNETYESLKDSKIFLVVTILWFKVDGVSIPAQVPIMINGKKTDYYKLIEAGKDILEGFNSLFKLSKFKRTEGHNEHNSSMVSNYLLESAFLQLEEEQLPYYDLNDVFENAEGNKMKVKLKRKLAQHLPKEKFTYQVN